MVLLLATKYIFTTREQGSLEPAELKEARSAQNWECGASPTSVISSALRARVDCKIHSDRLS